MVFEQVTFVGASYGLGTMLSASGTWVYLIPVILLGCQPHILQEKLKARARLSILSTAMQTGGDTEPGPQSRLVSHQRPVSLTPKLGGLPCRPSALGNGCVPRPLPAPPLH